MTKFGHGTTDCLRWCYSHTCIAALNQIANCADRSPKKSRSGLLVGLKWPPALSISSAGLSLLMLIAFGVRLKMRDSIVQSLPSLVLMLVNAYILVKSFQR